MKENDIKRVNVRVPLSLYDRLKEYCDTVNVPVSSAMCLFTDLMLNQLSADRMSRASKDMVDLLKSMPADDIHKAIQNA